MSGRQRRRVFLIISILSVFLMSFSFAKVLDSSPSPNPTPHFPGWPAGGIDWGNLVFPNVSGDCIAQLAKMAGQGVNETYAQMKIASGHELGDVGQWWNCTHIPSAQYCFISTDSPNCALSIPQCNIGLCLPSQCSVLDVENIAKQYFDNKDKNLSVIAHCGNEFSDGDYLGLTFSLGLLGTVTAILLIGTTVWLISTGEIKKLFLRVPQPVVVISPLPINESEKERGNGDNKQEEGENIEMEDKKGDDELVGYVMEDGLIGSEADSPVLPPLSPIELFFDRLAVYLTKESLFVKVWKSFAINHNFSRLLSPIPGEFGALNGLRFFNMLWIIWGHTLFFWIFIGADDLIYAYNYAVKEFWVQTPINGVLGVDSFFFLSGFLVAYFLYERLIAGKSMQWFLIYFHRIWRIVPMYLFVMLLWIFLTPFLGNGPFWWNYRQIVEHTSPNCWSNLLFINNFYPPNSNDQCMGWGWFLAVDMQFYIFSPFLIYLQYKKPILGWISLTIIALIDIFSSFVITYYYGFAPDLLIRQPHFFDYFYQKPYSRSSPYVVGMASAYIYSYIRRNRPNFKIPSIILNLGYLISLSTIFIVIYAIYWVDDFNQLTNSLYLSLSRLFWGLAVAYLMLTFFMGYGGILRTFFCLRLWQPLAKLTFGAYLVHPIVMWLVYYNQWEYIMFTYRNMWYFYIGHLVISFTISALLYLAVEKPTMNIEPFVIGGAVKLYYRIRGKDPSSLRMEDL